MRAKPRAKQTIGHLCDRGPFKTPMEVLIHTHCCKRTSTKFLTYWFEIGRRQHIIHKNTVTKSYIAPRKWFLVPSRLKYFESTPKVTWNHRHIMWWQRYGFGLYTKETQPTWVLSSPSQHPFFVKQHKDFFQSQWILICETFFRRRAAERKIYAFIWG